MATTMNISLPDDLRAFVDEQVHERAFGSTSEYMRDLIRKQRDMEKLRSLLLEGAASPVEGDFDDHYFDQLRGKIRSRSQSGGKKA